jgi:hypothetical protein
MKQTVLFISDGDNLRLTQKRKWNGDKTTDLLNILGKSIFEKKGKHLTVNI